MPFEFSIQVPNFLAVAPVEICDEILSYLCNTDLKSFSECSRICRKLAAPFLFAGLALTPESAAAFEAGVLCSVRSKVRKIYLKGKIYTGFDPADGDIAGYIETFRFCAKSLRLFPFVRKIYIEYGAYLWENLYLALWREISSALPNLKEVGLKVLRGVPDSDDSGSYEGFYEKLSPETQQFVGPKDFWSSDEDLNIDQFHRSLEVVRLYDSRVTSLYRDQSKYLQNFPIRSSVSSLRELYLTSPRIIIQNGPGTLTFPNLSKLEIRGLESNYVYASVLVWVSRHCPNLRSLGIRKHEKYRVSFISTGGSQTESFQMPKVKELSLTWPWNNPNPREHLSRYKRHDLDRFVRKLIDSGMDGLEEVRFFRIPAFGGSEDVIERSCRVTRDFGGCNDDDDVQGRVRLWWRKPFYVKIGQGVLGEEEDDGEDSEDDLDDNLPLEGGRTQGASSPELIQW
ncbi:hypothetical protein TWF718_002280 [Orbilia javanica]|uniref:F-box domain-containing protein n=1 Tax=Orbilia javanica TaxID=47235 RepID=A0AAN8MQB7_9PEZI